MHLNKNKSIFAIASLAIFGVLMALFPAQAQSTMGITATIFSSLAQIIIELVGKLLIVLIEILLAVVKYNDFINADAVKRGWILIRDFSNMAFLVIFIAIAFATILGVEKYEWKRLLPKLLIMAVVINFSKTICGILIDASQVVMITFVNGFKDVAAGNLIRGFGLSDMLSIRDLGADEGVTDNAIAAASVLAVILLIIAAVVVGIIVVMFLIRILMLWMLIILSPIAFMLSAAPGGEAQFQKWFQKFIKYAFMGPLLAFFLWLSFSVMAGVSPGSNLAQQNNIQFGETKTGLLEPAGNTSAAISGISRSDQLLSYGIAIGLLIMSLMVAQSLGVAGSSMAGDALSKIKSGGVKLGKLTALAGLTGGAGVAGLVAGKRAGKAGYDWMTKKDTLRGNLTRALGRKTDDKVSPGLSKALARGGAKVAGLLGMKDTKAGLEKFSQGAGMKMRVVKQAWKDRQAQREGEKVAESRGGTRDLLNKVIDGKNTDYETREHNKLKNEEKKNQQEGESLSTDNLLNIVETGDPIAQESALESLMEKGSFSSAFMNEKNRKENHEATIKYIEEGTERLKARRKYLDDEGGLQKEKNAIDSDKNLTDKEKGKKKKALDEEHGRLSSDIKKNEDYAKELRQDESRDTTAHRLVYVRDKFGNTSATAGFLSQLSSIARKNGEKQMYGVSKKNEDTQLYEMADLSTPAGREKQAFSMSIRAGFEGNNEVIKASESVYRDRIIRNKKDGKGHDIIDKYGNVETEEVLSDITISGDAQLQNMSGMVNNRNVSQINKEAFAAIFGAINSNYRKERIAAAGAPGTPEQRKSKIEEIDRKFAKIQWEKFDNEIVKKGILGSDVLGLFETRLQSSVNFDRNGNPIVKTSKVATNATAGQVATPATPTAQLKNSLNGLVTRLNVMQGQQRQGVDVSSFADKTSGTIDKMLEDMDKIFKSLPEGERKEAEDAANKLRVLSEELRKTPDIKDEGARKDRVNEIYKNMAPIQNELKVAAKNLKVEIPPTVAQPQAQQPRADEDEDEDEVAPGQAQEDAQAKNEFVTSLNELSSHIDDLTNNIDSSSADRAAENLENMLKGMADTIRELRGNDKSEADTMSSEIQDLVRELHSVSGINDKDEQKRAIDKLNDQMTKSNGELKNILRRIQL